MLKCRPNLVAIHLLRLGEKPDFPDDSVPPGIGTDAAKGLDQFKNGEGSRFMNQNAQLRKVQSTDRPVRSSLEEVTPAIERRWFEFDRGAVLRQIDLVHGTIDENATDLGMVAVEGVFDKPLSDELLRSSRSLHLLAQELNSLRGLVARASGYPRANKKLA